MVVQDLLGLVVHQEHLVVVEVPVQVEVPVHQDFLVINIRQSQQIHLQLVQAVNHF